MTDSSIMAGPEENPAKPAEAISTVPILAGAPTDYLKKLLTDIATMLAYANSRGIVLTSELRKKIDTLVNHPDVKSFDGFHSTSKSAKGP